MGLPLKVYISDWGVMDGVKVAVVLGTAEDGNRRMMRFREDGHFDWEPVEPMIEHQPTLRFPDDIARALLDALTRHYSGASDLHTVRADYLHARDRHDRLVDHLIVVTNSLVDLAAGATD